MPSSQHQSLEVLKGIDWNRTKLPIEFFDLPTNDLRQAPQRRRPCSCHEMNCGCCGGMNFQQINFKRIREFYFDCIPHAYRLSLEFSLIQFAQTSRTTRMNFKSKWTSWWTTICSIRTNFRQKIHRRCVCLCLTRQPKCAWNFSTFLRRDVICTCAWTWIWKLEKENFWWVVKSTATQWRKRFLRSEFYRFCTSIACEWVKMVWFFWNQTKTAAKLEQALLELAAVVAEVVEESLVLDHLEIDRADQQDLRDQPDQRQWSLKKAKSTKSIQMFSIRSMKVVYKCKNHANCYLFQRFSSKFIVFIVTYGTKCAIYGIKWSLLQF